jgi:hypothetical protein
MSSNIVAPSGYVDLNNDCEYSIDLKSTRSREYINPKEDLSFYFNTYITPKYGLDNINVNNVASFMKDLEMNWTKLTPDLKDKVLNIMVDGILNNPNGNYDFKNQLLSRIKSDVSGNKIPTSDTKSTFGSKSNFGMSGTGIILIAILFITIVSVLIYVYPYIAKEEAAKVSFGRYFRK